MFLGNPNPPHLGIQFFGRCDSRRRKYTREMPRFDFKDKHGVIHSITLEESIAGPAPTATDARAQISERDKISVDELEEFPPSFGPVILILALIFGVVLAVVLGVVLILKGG
jgi:hypothetical protein